MQVSAPIRHRRAIVLALAGLVIASAAAIAQTATGQKAAGQAKPAPTTPAPKAATPAAPAPTTAAPATTTQAKPAAAREPAPPGKGTADRYTATAANLGRVTGETITVDLIRWSTDAERDKVVATFKEKGDKELLPVLQGSPNIGYIWRSGSGFGSFVRYAYRWKGSDGEHVVLATDSDLNDWQKMATAKPAAGAAPAAVYPFTVIEIVLPAAGPSAGKMSLAAKVISDTVNKTIRLDNYTAAPVTLRGVRHQKGAAS